MTENTIEKAPGACDAEGFDTNTYGSDSATSTQLSKVMKTLFAALYLAGMLGCEFEVRT
jgi:hypothetical protein